MLWYHYVFGAVLIVFSIVITIVVLMQEGRSQNLSGAIAGGADTSSVNQREEQLRQSLKESPNG